jgi:hemoglobin/transferrin/lactoferrin receptor protein
MDSWLTPLVLAVLLATHGAAAEESDDEEPERPAGTVVVARAVPEEPLDALRAVEVLGVDELTRRRPRTVPEALAEVPGVFVQKTNHAGGSPLVRGLTGPHNLILVDGVRVNASTYRTGPLQYLNTVDSFSLQRIELLRGPGSVLYGSDAVGGVFELVTRDPIPVEEGQAGRFDPLVATRFESVDLERSGRLGLSFATDSFGLTGGATARVFDDLRAGGDVGLQPHSGYDELDWDAKLRVGRPGGHRLDVLYQSVRVTDAGRSDKLDSKGVLTMYDENFRDLVYASGLIRVRPLRTRVTITPSYQRQLETRRTIQFADEAHEQVSSVKWNRDVVHTAGGSLRFDTRLFARRLDLVYGARYYRDSIRSEAATGSGDDDLEPSSPGYPEGSWYETTSLYLLATGTPLRTATWVELVVYGGAQLCAFAAAAPGLEGVDDFSFRNAGGALAAGVHLRQRGRFNIGLGYNEGFRAPNLNEAALVGSTGAWFHVPNPDLAPEHADTVELSGRFRTGPVRFGATAYASLLKDYIARVPTTWEGEDEILGAPVVHNANQGRGQILGAEVQASVELPAFFTVGGDITYTWGRYEDAEAGWVPVSRIPPLFGTARVRFAPPWHDLFIDVIVQGAGKQERLSPLDETDARIPEGGTPGWSTVSLRAGFRPHPRLAVSFGASNLIDTMYRVHGSGVYGAGRSVWLALEVTGPGGS